MKTDNELIAEFMGLMVFKSYEEMQACPIETLTAWTIPDDPKWGSNYKKSWDKLMPVVERIGKLYNQAFPTNEVFIQKILAHEDPIEKEYIDVISTSICTPISEVYDEVVKFIKWYNKQPKP